MGVKVLTGENTFPGSGPITNDNTIREGYVFTELIKHIKNKENPVMVEIGCHWALWSLLFRSTYSGGRNILIELNKNALCLAEDNFKLNDFDFSSYWGGVFLEDSGTFHNKENDIEYERGSDGYSCECHEGPATGSELDFLSILEKESIEKIDVLHLDIQGSELPLLKQLVKSGKINDIDMIMVATHSREADLFIVELVNSTHFEVSNYHKWYGEDDGWFVLKNGKVS